MRLRAFPGAGVFVEAVSSERRGVGHIPSTAHVPLAEMAGGVTSGLQCASEGRRPRVQEVGLLASAVAGAGLQEAGDVPAGGEHAGGEPRARGRANRRNAIVLGEADAFAREAVEVGRGRELAAEAADIPIA